MTFRFASPLLVVLRRPGFARPPDLRRPARARTAKISAFTLIELMVVIGIMVLLMTLLVPAFNAIKGGNDVTSAAYDIAGVLQQARTHAIANNTYVWVGFYEEDATASTPTNTLPPYTGIGRVLLAAVASKDGTTSCQNPASTSTNRIPLTASSISQVGKLVRIENVHLADIGPPPTAPSTPPPAGSIDARPDFPYTSNSPSFDYQNRINSEDSHSPQNATTYPFVAQGYTFYKTIRFNPRGEANINSTYGVRQFVEIGLKPTRGVQVDTKSSNVAAIQVSGLGGDVKIYRR